MKKKDNSYVIPTKEIVIIGDWEVNIMQVQGPDTSKLETLKSLIGFMKLSKENKQLERLLEMAYGKDIELQLYSFKRLNFQQNISEKDRNNLIDYIKDELLDRDDIDPRILVHIDRYYSKYSKEYAVSDKRYKTLIGVMETGKLDPLIKGAALAPLIREMPTKREELFKDLCRCFKKTNDFMILKTFFGPFLKDVNNSLDNISKEIFIFALKCLSHKKTYVRYNATYLFSRNSIKSMTKEVGLNNKDILKTLKKVVSLEKDSQVKTNLTRAIKQYESD